MTFGDVLALQVSLSGIDRVQAGLDGLISKIENVDSAAMKAAQGGLAKLAGLATVIGLGIREAIADEATLTRLSTFTGSMEKARDIMAQIDALGRGGVFDKHSIEQAALTLEKSLGGAFEKNLSLLKELGVRMDGGISQAAELIARLERGQTFGIVQQLGEAGIGPDKLRQAGLTVSGRTIKNSPQEILAALEKLTKQQSAYEKMVNTTGSAWGRFKDQMAETLETIGYPFLTALTLMLEPVTMLLSAFRQLNDFTHGWASNVLIAMVAIGAVKQILPLMGSFLGIMKQLLGIETILAVIRNLTWVNIGAAVGRFIGFMKNLLSIQTALAAIEAIRAALQAAIAFAMGNVAGAIGALAIIGAAGYGAYRLMGGGGGGGNAPGPHKTPAAERPNRRDDIERVFHRMQGRGWTG